MRRNNPHEFDGGDIQSGGGPDVLTVTPLNDETHDISPDLWGIFFEDINSCADGGIASELVQNGAFEYNRSDSEHWSNYSFWTKEVPEGSFAAFSLGSDDPVAEENPHYAIVEVGQAPASLTNAGFDGMVFRSGQTYGLSLWARVEPGETMRVKAELLDERSCPLAEVTLGVDSAEWKQLTATLTASGNASAGSLRLTFLDSGTADIDFVSLEPCATYKGLKHFRADLVEVLDRLHPRFMRFPGGCISHGYGFANMYRWKRTVGPVEHRPHNFNCWGYHQSFRIGYYEYLCLCETIGAKPLPILPAAVGCQNTQGGPVAIAQRDMPAYIQEVLDLIDFCNAKPEESQWAALRAEMGHPEPFGLEYLGIGNEDRIDAVFENRFAQIFEAVQAAHPEIKVVGTVGTDPTGSEWEEGWRFARELQVPIVDEHAYRSPSWWFRNLDHWDGLDRKGPKVYLGEYGSWGTGLINALSEAAIMTRMEANGDAVAMASYAPLFCKNGHAGWNPNLIYFDNERIYRTYSYWVQKMFADTRADSVTPVRLDGPVQWRREPSEHVRLRFTHDKVWGGDLMLRARNVQVEANGETVCLPDMTYVTGIEQDLGLALQAEEYTVRMRIDWLQGGSDFFLDFGDLESGVFDRLRLSSVCCRVYGCSEGGEYDITSADVRGLGGEVRSGDGWNLEIQVAERGRRVRVLVDGRELMAGIEEGCEIRRTASLAHDSRSGETHLRLVNAVGVPMRVDVANALGRDSLGEVRLLALSGNDPVAGSRGEEAPDSPVESVVDLSEDSVLTVLAWSFVIATVANR